MASVMTRTLGWQLYVSGYTLLFGLPLLAVPDEVISLLGFRVTGEPWVRLAGMFLLTLSYLSFGIYRERAVPMLFYSIVVRTFIVVVLLSLALAGHPPFLYVMALIVGIGVVGSTASYVIEKPTAPD